MLRPDPGVTRAVRAWWILSRGPMLAVDRCDDEGATLSACTHWALVRRLDPGPTIDEADLEGFLARISHAFEMFMGKASGALLYGMYRKRLITQPMGISGAPAG